MKLHPLRAPLPGQAAAALRNAIAEGVWERWLPGELELVKCLHVGRNTLRAALAQLEREGLVSAGQGRRREIHRKNTFVKGRRVTSTRVVLLSPEPFHRQPHSAVLWMGELRAHLASFGYKLEMQSPQAVWRRHPGRALEDMASRLAPAAWILHRSTPQMQRWFSASLLPCLVAGTRHEDVDLSSLDIDHRATGRHAAGRFLARGRRDLALLRMRTTLAGDQETVAGFREGAGNAAVRDIFHDGTSEGVCAALRRAFQHAPPDGLFVFRAEHALAALGHLTRSGVRIPADLALICRDDEPFLSHAVPEPARYVINAAVFARKISGLVRDILCGGGAKTRARVMMPDFLPGKIL